MSLTLALDTVTDRMVAVLGEDGVPLAEVAVGARRHAAALAPAIADLLRLGGTTLGEVENLVVADGPGSFTGIRIGVATAQGLCRAHDALRMWTVPSLLVTAASCRDVATGAIAALYDALRGDVYGAVYRFTESGVDALLPPTLGTVDELQRRVEAPTLAVGDGAVRYGAEAQAWSGRPPVGPPTGAPTGEALLAAHAMGACAPVDDPATFEPTYGRPAEAQARWEKAHGQSLPDSPGQYR